MLKTFHIFDITYKDKMKYSLENAWRYIPDIERKEISIALKLIFGIKGDVQLTRIIKGTVSPPYNEAKEAELYLNAAHPEIREVWQPKTMKK
jgi:hypothetical protein